MCQVTAQDHSSSQGRHKPYTLAELSSVYHCSVIGTCLDFSVLEKVAEKFYLTVSGHTEYDLHHAVVVSVGRHLDMSKYLNKLLNKQHAASIKRYRKIQCEKTLYKTWQEDLLHGRYVGSYWAMMRHPLGAKIWHQAHGDIHMLTHQKAQEKLVDVHELKALQERVKTLTTENQRLSQRVQKQAVKIERQQRDMQRLQNTARNISPIPRMPCSVGADKYAKQVAHLQAQLQKVKQQHTDSLAEKALWQTEKQQLICENRMLTDKLSGAQDNSPQVLSAQSQPDSQGDFRVLYVGGRPKSSARMRSLVEQERGEFYYHDGGLDGNTANLDQLLKRADFVLCPVTCVSHDACLKVKRYCKRHEKPFIPLTSTGISAFTHGLCLGSQRCENAHVA